MKKIIFEIISMIIAYLIVAIYGYYNTSEPVNRYSWLISAVVIIIIYAILKIIEKIEKRKKEK